MRYEHTPRPLTEEHYHVRELIERQEARAADRSRFQAREKERGEREHIIRDSKEAVLTDFWCRNCQKDFQAVAQRQAEEDWNSDGRIAFYKTKCFCGEWAIRLVTDRDRDPYWRESRGVRADRAKHSLDTIQPFEEGFNMVYGKR